MYSTGSFQYRWLKGYIYSSCYHHHQIKSIHISHCYHIFFRVCVSEMFVTSYSVTYCVYIPGKPGICFHYYFAVYDESKRLDTFWLEYRIRLLVHYTISLSSLCKLIWRYWTHNMPVRYILSSVWVRFTHFPCDDWENIYALSYYLHQLGSVNYYPSFRVKSWNNGVRCMSFCILVNLWYG